MYIKFGVSFIYLSFYHFYSSAAGFNKISSGNCFMHACSTETKTKTKQINKLSNIFTWFFLISESCFEVEYHPVQNATYSTITNWGFDQCE